MISIIAAGPGGCGSIAVDQNLMNNLLQNATANNAALISALPATVIASGQPLITTTPPTGSQSSSNSGSNTSSPSSSSTPKGRSIRCQFCPQKHYSHYSVYISHLNHSHRQDLQSDIRIESRTFDNYDEFSKFKVQVEYQSGTHYNKSNSRSDSYILFKCHRFGEPRGANNSSSNASTTTALTDIKSNNKKSRKCLPKEWNWTKSCPAFMRMIKIENGKYWTEYCTYHLGHDDCPPPAMAPTIQMPLAMSALPGIPGPMTNDQTNQTNSGNNDPMDQFINNNDQQQLIDSSNIHSSMIINVQPPPPSTQSTIKENNQRKSSKSTKQQQDNSTNHQNQTTITIPNEHGPLFQNILELIKNQDKLNQLKDLVNSLLTSGSSQQQSSNNSATTTSKQSSTKQTITTPQRTSPRKRKQASS